MTDPTERLAEVLPIQPRFMCSGRCPHGATECEPCRFCDAAYLTAQGFGHRDDILRAFAEHEKCGWLTIMANRYLAAKPVTDTKEDTDA